MVWCAAMKRLAGMAITLSLSTRLAPARRDAAPLLIGWAWIAFTYACGPVPVGSRALAGIWATVVGVAVVIAAGGALVRARLDGPLRESDAMLAAYRTAYHRLRSTGGFRRQRVVSAVLHTVTTVLTIAAFAEWKSWMNRVRPFAHDETFMRLDRALHFGVDPWRLVRPLLSSLWVERPLELVYTIGWPILFIAGTIVVAASRASRDRTAFLVAALVMWPVAGIWLAFLGSSAGPCFYDLVVDGPNPYADLVAQIDYLTRTAQIRLWDQYLTPGELSSISAMPSMHVLSSTVLWLGLRREWPRAGLAFLVIMFIGSVALGWHYAVDGYAGVLIAIALWTAVRRLTRHETRSPASPGR